MTGADIAGLMVGVTAVGLAYSVLARANYRALNPWAVVHFIASAVSTLFPLQLAGLLAAWLMWSVGHGALQSWTGRGGLLLSALALVGFVVFLLRQFQSREVLDRALRESLPEADLAETGTCSPPQLWRVLRPLHFKRDDVERIPNLSYGPAGKRNHLDIYRPRDTQARATPLPVLLQIHGSGWLALSKDHQALPLIHLMASRGWLVVSINYRLSPAARFPAHLNDVKRAIAWIRDNIAGYGGNPDFIITTGGSAGGQLAALAAMTPNQQDLQPGFESADTSVKAAVPIYGRYDFLDRHNTDVLQKEFVKLVTRLIMPGSPEEVPDLWCLASPIAQIHAEVPPFFVIHGTYDSVIAVESVRVFVKRLRTISSQPVAYAELPGVQHGFDFVQSPVTEFTIQAIRRFLEVQYRCYLAALLPAGSLTEKTP